MFFIFLCIAQPLSAISFAISEWLCSLFLKLLFLLKLHVLYSFFCIKSTIKIIVVVVVQMCLTNFLQIYLKKNLLNLLSDSTYQTLFLCRKGYVLTRCDMTLNPDIFLPSDGTRSNPSLYHEYSSWCRAQCIIYFLDFSLRSYSTPQK